MKTYLPFIFALTTAVCWGLYGPTLGTARLADPDHSPFKPYFGIGIAYLVIAIAGGLFGMWMKGDSFDFAPVQPEGRRRLEDRQAPVGRGHVRVPRRRQWIAVPDAFADRAREREHRIRHHLPTRAADDGEAPGQLAPPRRDGPRRPGS